MESDGPDHRAKAKDPRGVNHASARGPLPLPNPRPDRRLRHDQGSGDRLALNVKRLAALVLSLVAVAVVALLAGCGGGSKSAVTAEATSQARMPSRAELAQTYLRIVKPLNDASDRFYKRTAHWNQQTTGKEAAKDSAPSIAALRTFDDKVLRVDWPPETAVDVKELVRADRAFIGDLRALENVDVLSLGLVNQARQDTTKGGAAGNVVRADLGLPPVRKR